MENKKFSVFISWSQEKSHMIAKIIKESLCDLFDNKIEFWVSSEDIEGGSFPVSTILDALSNSSMALLCLDKSNYQTPWIYYEAGIVFGKNWNIAKDTDAKNTTEFKNLPIVVPMVFDKTEKTLFEKTPLKNMQIVSFEKSAFKKFVTDVNKAYFKTQKTYALPQEALMTRFDQIWKGLSDKISVVIKGEDKGGRNMLTEKNIVEKIKKYNSFPVPTPGNVIRFASGFETDDFYKFLLENVSRRLYIFGRKNRKLSNSRFDVMYKKMVKKKIDIKILFLDPNCDNAQNNSAQDNANFVEELKASIKRFRNRYDKLGLDISDHCRFYSEKRMYEIIVADNVVLYKELAYTSDGKPLHFTGQSFYVTSVESQLGTEQFATFSNVWNTNNSYGSF